MTKEIIIDGCNVAECRFLEDGMCNAQRSCDGYTGAECKYDNKNCYFKQLQRLKQENEELKKTCQDCEDCIDYIPCKTLRDMDYDLQILIQQKDKYKQALEEIREMTSVNAINTCWEILNTCDDCKSKKDCGIQSPITKLKFIENKINEVLEGNEDVEDK